MSRKVVDVSFTTDMLRVVLGRRRYNIACATSRSAGKEMEISDGRIR